VPDTNPTVQSSDFENLSKVDPREFVLGQCLTFNKEEFLSEFPEYENSLIAVPGQDSVYEVGDCKEIVVLVPGNCGKPLPTSLRSRVLYDGKQFSIREITPTGYNHLEGKASYQFFVEDECPVTNDGEEPAYNASAQGLGIKPLSSITRVDVEIERYQDQNGVERFIVNAFTREGDISIQSRSKKEEIERLSENNLVELDAGTFQHMASIKNALGVVHDDEDVRSGDVNDFANDDGYKTVGCSHVKIGPVPAENLGSAVESVILVLVSAIALIRNLIAKSRRKALKASTVNSVK